MLPYELWTRVAACLTLDELAQGRLYALNAPFLAHYLRERYRTLRLGSVSGSILVLSKKLNHIQYAALCLWRRPLTGSSSLVAENVRTLDVALEQDSFKPEYGRSTSRLVHFVRKHIVFKNKMRNVRKSFPSFSQMHAAFSELKSLTAIRCALYAEDPPFVFDSQRFLTSSMSAAWTASRNTLTSLILTIKVYPLFDLGLDTITFPHLQQFSFILLSKHFSVLVDPVIDSTPREVSNLSAISLAHFLARHQRTLEILTLVFPINAQTFAANLLNQFPILPSLHYLKLHFTPDGIIRKPSLPLGLFNTLQSNSQSLTHLHLIFDNMFGYCNFFRQEDSRNHRDWWTAQSFERIHFPKLQNLRLHFDGILSDTPLMVQLAVSSTASVFPLSITLLLHTHSFNPRQLLSTCGLA